MIIILGLIAGICLVGWFTIWLIIHTERESGKAKDNAPAILDETFGGDDDVIFKINMVSLPFEDVVLGAKERGYRLASQSRDTKHSQTLIFERVSD